MYRKLLTGKFILIKVMFYSRYHAINKSFKKNSCQIQAAQFLEELEKPFFEPVVAEILIRKTYINYQNHSPDQNQPSCSTSQPKDQCLIENLNEFESSLQDAAGLELHSDSEKAEDPPIPNIPFCYTPELTKEAEEDNDDELQLPINNYIDGAVPVFVEEADMNNCDKFDTEMNADTKNIDTEAFIQDESDDDESNLDNFDDNDVSIFYYCFLIKK